MSEQERRLDRERRNRGEAETIAARKRSEEPAPSQEPAPSTDLERPRGMGLDQQMAWADLQVRQAINRGEFDDLPGAGKPIPGLGSHDPDWWIKSLIAREQISGVLPPGLALRKEHEELDARLDREGSEAGVRLLVEDFNERVVKARRQQFDGPPVITPTRDADKEVAAWRARRAERRNRSPGASQDHPPHVAEPERPVRRSHWWRKLPKLAAQHDHRRDR
jgi:hypothetical protein